MASYYSSGLSGIREHIEEFVYNIRFQNRRWLNWLRWLVRKSKHRFSGTLYRTTLQEILETGQLGNLEIGMTMSDVKAYLGPPDAKTDNGLLLAYEFVEVGFNHGSDEGCEVIQYIKFPWKFAYFRLPPNIHLDGFVPSYKTTFDEFIQYLKYATINHEVAWIDIYDEHFPVVFTEIENKGMCTKTIFDDETLRLNATYIQSCKDLQWWLQFLTNEQKK